MNPGVLSLILVILLPSVLPGNPQQRDTAPETRTDAGLTSTRLRGEYGLEHYGFTVRIPEDVIAYGPYCDSDGICGSSHGFAGKLRGDDKAEIDLFVEYSPTHDYPPEMKWSNRKILDYVLSPTHPPGTSLSIVKLGDAMLDRLPATRVVAKFQDPESPFAFRVELDCEVLYRIELHAAADRYAKDLVVLESLIKSFRATPLP